MSFKERTYFRRSIKVQQEQSLKGCIVDTNDKTQQVAHYCDFITYLKDVRQIITLPSPEIKMTLTFVKMAFMNWQQQCNKNKSDASYINNAPLLLNNKNSNTPAIRIQKQLNFTFYEDSMKISFWFQVID